MTSRAWRLGPGSVAGICVEAKVVFPNLKSQFGAALPPCLDYRFRPIAEAQLVSCLFS
jgi:hypothetical protein